MELLRTALLQIAPCGTLEGNLKKGIEYCKEAKKMGAHIALFPEMWSCGYDIGSRNYEEWKKEAVQADGPFVRAFENMTAICTCNYPGTVPDCNGGSTVFDGVAYLPELPGSRDMCILQAGSEEPFVRSDHRI